MTHDMSSSTPRITLLVQRPDAPSFRLRIAAVGSYLAAGGLARIATRVVPRRPEWLRVWRLARTWRESDVIVISKFKLLAGERGFVRRRCPTWVWDIDDAVMVARPTSPGAAPGDAGWRRRRFARMLAGSRIVVAGSRSLAELVGPSPTRLEIWPTPVDLAHFPTAAHPERREVRLGWIGLGANLRYLRDLQEPLRELRRRGHNVVVHVVSDRAPELGDVPVRLVPWDPVGEGAKLADCDIGLAPLPDDPWTRGKAGYRCVQYAAAGLPCVAAPVGAQREVVDDGVTGLWADSPEAWVTALDRLARDRALRSAMGRAARDKAEREYALDVLAPRYGAWLLELVPRAGSDR